MNTWVEKNEFAEQIERLVHQLKNANDPRVSLKEVTAMPLVATPEVGTRSREVLFQNEQFELVLMTWGAGSSSPIHGHGGSQCYMQSLGGELIETRYRPYNAIPVHEAKLTTGHVSYINDEASFHKLSSVTGAVSLHLYARPLLRMQVFDEAQNEWFDKVAAEIP